MSLNEPIPYHWKMQDSPVLAHRIALPEKLSAWTALTVDPGQNALVFLDGQEHLFDQASTYLLTGNVVHDLAQGYHIAAAGGEAVLPFHAQMTVFDMRPKLWIADPIDLTAANGEHASVTLSVSYCVDNPEKLNLSGAAYRSGADGSDLHPDDPIIQGAFQAAIAEATPKLAERAAALATGSGVISALIAPDLRSAVSALFGLRLMPVGLRVVSLNLMPAHATCCYCGKELSVTEVRRRFCSAVDDNGQPQRGCNRRLHACPSCGAIVGPERSTCPTCGDELLYCSTPGCETYRRVEKGRFCVVCKCACYPQPPREFLSLS